LKELRLPSEKKREEKTQLKNATLRSWSRTLRWKGEKGTLRCRRTEERKRRRGKLEKKRRGDGYFLDWRKGESDKRP